MTGTILQINVSRGGLPKMAVREGTLQEGGFVGDAWAHPKIHGGPEKAVLLIAAEVIEDLRGKGFPVYPGALGENLTTSGLDCGAWRAGQQYRVGEAEIELTDVRMPCSSLDVYGPAIKNAVYDKAVKAGDARSPQWARSGFYARVLRPGLVFPGNPIRLMSALA